MEGDLIFYQFSRSKVERGDFGHFLSLYGPDKLPTGRRLLEMMNRFVFCIEGYDSDPREIHLIPEVRRFYSAFHGAWPYWLYFCNLDVDMRGFGSHNQPPGTWSDDSSLLLCSADSLVRYEFDTEDMGKRFLAWYREDLWTPHGRVFDVGVTTSRALSRLSTGVRAEVAGDDGENSNGNGSLMRIIPVSLRFSRTPTKQFLHRVHRASAITHRHARSLLACGLYSLVIRELLVGVDANTAVAQALRSFRAFYEANPYWAVEVDSFQLLLAGDLGGRPESEIDSSGYVVHTLTASLWCLLTTSGFEECVLRAVNLGGDTDTTGCVAGGLSGVYYGLNAIPGKWLQALARRDEIESLFNDLAALIPEVA